MLQTSQPPILLHKLPYSKFEKFPNKCPIIFLLEIGTLRAKDMKNTLFRGRNTLQLSLELFRVVLLHMEGIPERINVGSVCS